MKFIYAGNMLATVIIIGVLSVFTQITPSVALDTAQKAEFEALIRAYILENPEILVEAQQALELKQAKAQKERAKKALAEQGELIFASKNQFEIGNPKADVTVVEFFDYNCSFCKRAMADMNKLLENDSSLKFVMKELPILSEGSVTAHRISIAVGRLAPGKYPEFHRKLLNSPGHKNGKRALMLAEEMGLDIKKVLAVSKQDDINEAFREVNGLASVLGMNGTPSYVIGDEVIFGALGFNVLKAKIDNVRKCGSTTCS